MPDRVGRQIGNYRLVKLLGSGGFAEVYLGQHVHLASKQAAIKILHLLNVDVKKFQEEAETTEKLVHPHIVRLLDFALEGGTPFLVLDYAPGGSLRSHHPKGSIVSLDTVTGYLKEIAPALQYAHDLHILHRDIKPDNVLIGRQGELLVSDFGIAVLTQTGRTSTSSTYDIGGTPYYMAPETYQGRPVKESDQYALAVVVYEWLCGTVPFSQGNFIQLGYQHAYQPVPPLHEKNPDIPAAVEEVVLKALAKEPKDRFTSVQAFLQAFEQVCTVKSNPIQPGTTLYTYRGHFYVVNAVAWSPNGSRIASASSGQVRVWNVADGKKIFDYREHDDTVDAVAWSPDGTRIASGSARGRVLIWDATTGTTVLNYHTQQGGVNSFAWSPDGKRIASGSADKYLSRNSENTLQVRDVITGKLLLAPQGYKGDVYAVAWSPDGRYIASAHMDNTVRIWDAMTGKSVFIYQKHTGYVCGLSWSSDSTRIASGGYDQTVQVWNSASGITKVTYGGHSNTVSTVSWSSDGRYIASGCSDNTVQVWDAITGKNLLTYRGHVGGVKSVVWSPDGKFIASGGDDRTVRVWVAM